MKHSLVTEAEPLGVKEYHSDGQSGEEAVTGSVYQLADGTASAMGSHPFNYIRFNQPDENGTQVLKTTLDDGEAQEFAEAHKEGFLIRKGRFTKHVTKHGETLKRTVRLESVRRPGHFLYLLHHADDNSNREA